tara:strand:+ start:6311 stop:7015 length:705 start_codon:yes stop_codon:yes gene_type:complete
MNFSVIIPILNESKNIEPLSKLLKKNLINVKFEIIFVDDNSTDNSKKILEKIKSHNINYIIRRKKKDLTQSCFEGILKSKYENLVIMDGDLQHRPECLKGMIKKYTTKNSVLLIGVRDFSKTNGLSFIRFLASKIIIIFINTLLGNKTKDPMSGFFIIKKKIFLKLKPQLYGKGFKILADLIYSQKNLRIHEYKISFKKRYKNISKMNIIVLIHILLLIITKFYNKLFSNLFKL